MWRLITHYRAYLAAKALPLDGLELSLEARWLMLPWIAPLIILAGVGVVAHPADTVMSWAFGILGGISLVGLSLVLWEFIVKPLRNDWRGARGKQDRD